MFLLQTLTAALVFALIVIVPARGAEPASAEPADPIEAVYYRYAVVEYCGLVSPMVAHGFEVERDRLVAEAGVDEEQHRRLRLAGWTAADREWSNRGLGGFRNWCGTEGQAAAVGFAAGVP